MSAPAAPIRFGMAPDGAAVELVTLELASTRAAIMTWGASLQDFRLADHGPSLVLGSPDVAPYFGPMAHFGATVGPIANRIAGGRAPLGSGFVALERNEAGRTSLHSGSQGCSRKTWQLDGVDATSCALSLRVPDGAGGRPGTLDLTVVYRLGADATLEIEMTGRTDAPTFCNLAHHSYWTLDAGASVEAQRLRVAAEQYLPVDSALIPRGAPVEVTGSRFDFRAARPVHLPGEAGLDHNFCLDGGTTGEPRPVAWLEAGGLGLEVATTEPGLQVYDAAGLPAGLGPGHDGRRYGPMAGLALEPQRWPDAPNQPGYPSILLEPGETYRQVSRFRPYRVAA